MPFWLSTVYLLAILTPHHALSTLRLLAKMPMISRLAYIRTFRLMLVLVFTITAFVALLFFNASLARAGSWWQITTTDSVGNGVWDQQENNSGYPNPHGGFSSTSNLCKTCHAVHLAGENSWRLLKDGSVDETRTQGERIGEVGMGNQRSTECMYCHDATSGATTRSLSHSTAKPKVRRLRHPPLMEPTTPTRSISPKRTATKDSLTATLPIKVPFGVKRRSQTIR